MRTAREVIAEALSKPPVGWQKPVTHKEFYSEHADAALAALDAQGLCVVSKADVYCALRGLREGANMRRLLGVDAKPLTEAANRLDAALAAGGAQ